MTESVQCLVISRCIKQDGQRIDEIVNQLPFEDKKAGNQILQEISDTTLSNFLANYDPNTYHLLNLLYEVTVTKYKIFYESLVSYKHDKSLITSTKPFECQVWSQPHLIPLTFQYLDLKSLIQCSLVNVKWFINAVDKNSTYYLNLSDLIDCTFPATMEQQCKSDNKIKTATMAQIQKDYYHCRIWRRFSHARNVYWYCFGKQFTVSKKLIKLVQLLKKIEKFECELYYSTQNICQLIEMILKTNNKHLKICQLNIFETHGGILLPKIDDNCKLLQLNQIHNINEKWCNKLSFESNLNGIESLIIDDLLFSATNSLDRCNLIDNIANKFINLEYFKIIGPTTDMLTFWQALPKTVRSYDYNHKYNKNCKLPRTMNKNCKKIEFEYRTPFVSFESKFVKFGRKEHATNLLETIVKHKLSINELCIAEEDYGIQFLIDLLNLSHIQQSVECLQIVTDIGGFENGMLVNNDNDKLLLKLCKLRKLEISGKSYKSVGLGVIIEFLEFIVENSNELNDDFLIILNLYVDVNDDLTQFSFNFQSFCELIIQLLLLNVRISLILRFDTCNIGYQQFEQFGNEWIYPWFIKNYDNDDNSAYIVADQKTIASESCSNKIKQGRIYWQAMNIPIVLFTNDDKKRVCKFLAQNVTPISTSQNFGY